MGARDSQRTEAFLIAAAEVALSLEPHAARPDARSSSKGLFQ
jgi:hypothetical protein